MNIVLDTHTHTLVSGHAYNTVKEMAAKAAEKGLQALAITDHAPSLRGSASIYHFMNLYVLPREMNGVQMFWGCELNIMDETGRVDLPEELYQRLDLNIASIHAPKECYGLSRGIVKNTQAYVKAMEHKGVNIIGHPDDSRFPVDFDTIVAAAKENHVLIELNNSSLNPSGYRENAYGNQVKILELCKKYNVAVSLGSDAHWEDDIANFSRVTKVVEECNFPYEMVVNTSVDKLLEYINYKK